MWRKTLYQPASYLIHLIKEALVLWNVQIAGSQLYQHLRKFLEENNGISCLYYPSVFHCLIMKKNTDDIHVFVVIPLSVNMHVVVSYMYHKIIFMVLNFLTT